MPITPHGPPAPGAVAVTSGDRLLADGPGLEVPGLEVPGLEVLGLEVLGLEGRVGLEVAEPVAVTSVDGSRPVGGLDAELGAAVGALVARRGGVVVAAPVVTGEGVLAPRPGDSGDRGLLVVRRGDGAVVGGSWLGGATTEIVGGVQSLAPAAL